jgi:hypothetical protein
MMNFSGYTIRQVSDDYLAGYDGFNFEAAQELKLDRKIEKDEILLNQTRDFTLKVHTIIHEVTESVWMKKGLPYFQAHLKAEKAENNFDNLKEMFDFIFSHKKFYDWLLCGKSADGEL